MGVPYEIERELRYELGMADFTHEHLTGWAEAADDDTPLGVQLALLESFLAHVRLVDEFLGGRPRAKPRPGDVVAGHFVVGWQGGGFLSQVDRERTDRQLLHLTTARRVRERWPIHYLAGALGAGFLEFVAALPEDDRAAMAGAVEHAQRMVGRSTARRRREISLGLVWADAAQDRAEQG